MKHLNLPHLTIIITENWCLNRESIDLTHMGLHDLPIKALNKSNISHQ